jgi:hypothetical protein
VEETVHHELPELVTEESMSLPRLPAGGREGNNDVTEADDAIGVGSKRPAHMERKREHIRRTVMTTDPSVQGTHRCIRNEDERDFAPSWQPEQALCGNTKRAQRQRRNAHPRRIFHNHPHRAFFGTRMNTTPPKLPISKEGAKTVCPAVRECADQIRS